MLIKFLSNKYNIMGLISICLVTLGILFKDNIFTLEERIICGITIVLMCMFSYLIGMSRGIYIELMKIQKYADLIDKEQKKLKTDKDG